MSSEEIIQKLAELFKQKEAIDNAIVDLINSKKLKGERKIAVIKERKKWTRRGRKPNDNREKRYYCLDCKEVFNSTASKIDATCPNCNSIHIDYAQRHNR